jgi:thiamine-phosphate pyrophosphorylase
MPPLNKPALAPLLCYVTDRRSLAAAESMEAHEILLQKIAVAAAAGVDYIQIREKDLPGKECTWLTREAVRLVSPTGKDDRARILVNDRLDAALAAQADGVHLGEQSLQAQEARRLVKSLRRQDFLIGVSCHSLEAAKAAERGGADYLFFGPVFATPSKTAYGAPQGLARLAEVCRAIAVPVLAIGGITRENAAACFSAGASGIAAIRLFQDTRDLASLVQGLRRIPI